MIYLLFTTLFLASLALAVRPFLARRAVAWPAEAPDPRDDVARAVSGLRDLEFARAAGTIAPEDHARLRALLERSAFTPARADVTSPAPWRTLLIAAALAGIAAVLVVNSLPQAAGDRAPGEPITGSVPTQAPAAQTIAELERRANAAPSDIPTLLALGDAYLGEGRVNEAAKTYQAVLGKDPNNVAALNGIGYILFSSGQLQGSLVAADRVLALRPRDPDALFLKGLIQYQTNDFKGAVDTWTIYLDVGQFDGDKADMVRALFADAKTKLGR